MLRTVWVGDGLKGASSIPFYLLVACVCVVHCPTYHHCPMLYMFVLRTWNRKLFMICIFCLSYFAAHLILGFYRGIAPGVTGSLATGATYFGFIESTKKWIEESHPSLAGHWAHFIAGAVGMLSKCLRSHSSDH